MTSKLTHCGATHADMKSADRLMPYLGVEFDMIPGFKLARAHETLYTLHRHAQASWLLDMITRRMTLY